MLYIIGLGLNSKGISLEGIEAIKRCKKVYLENYTVDFPYSIGELTEVTQKKIEPMNREDVESLKIVDEAEKLNVALLVYGSPLTATTHISIVEEAKATGIKYKLIYGASVLDSLGETGLQLYKFGKIASMPEWKKSYEPTSFMEIVKENISIKAHSLILIDIGLNISQALEQLEKSANECKIKLDKLILCQSLGTKNSKIFYKNLYELKEFSNVRKPYCIIIPSTKLHHVEKEFLKNFE